MGVLQYNSIGTVIRLTIEEDGSAVNVSGVSTKQIKFTDPGGTVTTQTATFYTDGTDGIIQYTTVDGDLDVVGEWQAQAYVAGLSGWTGHSTIHRFRVEPNLS